MTWKSFGKPVDQKSSQHRGISAIHSIYVQLDEGNPLDYNITHHDYRD